MSKRILVIDNEENNSRVSRLTLQAAGYELARPAMVSDGIRSANDKKGTSPQTSFWTSQAQRLLSDYLWKEGKVPPTRRLIMSDIDRDELPIAARWQTH